MESKPGESKVERLVSRSELGGHSNPTQSPPEDNLNPNSTTSTSKIDQLIEISKQILSALERQPQAKGPDPEGQNCCNKAEEATRTPDAGQPPVWRTRSFGSLTKGTENLCLHRRIFGNQDDIDLNLLDKRIEDINRKTSHWFSALCKIEIRNFEPL